MKKYIIIILTVVILGLLGWMIFGREEITPPATTSGESPFGSGEEFDVVVLPQGEEGSGANIMYDKEGVPVADLFRVSDTPIAGAVAFSRGGGTILRYVERATGHIYEVPLPKDKATEPLEPIKITNTTLPKIYEAYFRSDGAAVLLRSINKSDVVENMLITLSASTTGSTDGLYKMSAANLRGNLTSVAVGIGNALYYAERSSKTIASSGFDGQTSKVIYRSSFTNWQLGSVTNQLLSVYPKPSASAQGSLYAISITGGAISKIFGSQFNLSGSIDPTGSWSVYSYSKNGIMVSEARNLKNGLIAEVSPTALSEKCVWSLKKAGKLFCGSSINEITSSDPEGWYRGEISFSDSIWSFDSSREISELLSDPLVEFGVNLDVINPKLSPAEDYLIFTNKIDMTLWALRLPKP